MVGWTVRTQDVRGMSNNQNSCVVVLAAYMPRKDRAATPRTHRNAVAGLCAGRCGAGLSGMVRRASGDVDDGRCVMARIIVGAEEIEVRRSKIGLHIVIEQSDDLISVPLDRVHELIAALQNEYAAAMAQKKEGKA